jgi:benzoyl-CoA reductase/2-hydroxyglutaryl-CoA dehydratase subunit BcrC/BadD/HgdB
MTYDLNELQALLAKMTPGNVSAKELAKTLEAGIRSRSELAKFHDTTDYQADAAVFAALVNAARGGLIADHQALQARVAELKAEVWRLRADLNLERTGGFALLSTRLAEIERAALAEQP